PPAQREGRPERRPPPAEPRRGTPPARPEPPPPPEHRRDRERDREEREHNIQRHKEYRKKPLWPPKD
ncbi:MAG: hypothetical protein KAR37_09180, partial [Alphaproteobacteria bacterium]|nr:hypothetical protein [Alphaproteobacteria bacterium]